MAFNVDGITSESTTNFVGKDGFFWWVGEVEDNEDPMEIGRVRVRVLGYYTNVRGGTTADLPTKELPWAVVMQHTCQPGNDKQGESSGQLQPGAIVMGFFMDGESAQMPIVIGVMRINKDNKSKDKKQFAFTGETMEPGVAPNAATLHPSAPNDVNARTKAEGYIRNSDNNSVSLPGSKTGKAGGKGSPDGIQSAQGLNGSGTNPAKPSNPTKPFATANGVGGPWKSLDYELSYLVEDIADTAGTLIKGESGDFLDIVSGKLVTAKELTWKVQNFLGSVFAQVVSAIRQSVANLAESLSLASLVSGALGIPYATFAAVQAAITAILKSLCTIDNQLLSYISDPIGSLTNKLNSFLDGLIDKASMIVQGVQDTIDSVVCSVNKILDSIQDLVSTVTGIVDGIDQAKEIIEAWKAGSGIFSAGTDLMKNGLTSITGLIMMFIKLTGSGCNREAEGGKDTVGWYPLFGVTHCTPEELAEINAIRGSSRGSCGSNDSGGNLIDNIIHKADPYLTTAKTYINGAYDLFIGTPGRQTTIKKSPSGSTHTSVSLNNYQNAKYEAEKTIRQSKVEMTDEERTKKVESAAKKANKGKGENGNLVADHFTWAGNLTEEVRGDECCNVHGDRVETVYGDYRLKVNGDFHLEVGGGMFIGAEGSPKIVDKKGNKKNEKIQKHTIRFGSDVDINTVGAKFEVQGAECNIASKVTNMNSTKIDIKADGATSIAAGELLLTGQSVIDVHTPLLNELLNAPPSKIGLKSGKMTTCFGSIETHMFPGGSAADAIPRYIVDNVSGSMFWAYGPSCTYVGAGLWKTVTGGAANITAGGVGGFKAGGVLTLTAGGNVKVTGATILLN